MDVSLDKFLGGKIELFQPLKGFRAGTDTVMLASAVPAKKGDQILEFGVGSGIALCCLGARVPGVIACGVEIQSSIVEIARQNLDRCDMVGEIHCADVMNLPKTIRMQQFDHVMMNPPFFDSLAHTPPNARSKAIAHISDKNVSDWVKIAGKRLKPKGYLTIIHRAESLREILSGMDELGDVRVLPITSDVSSEAKTILIQARKQTAGKLKLLRPFITHDSKKLETMRLKEITREAAPLSELY